MSFVVDHIIAVSAVLTKDGVPVTRGDINAAVRRLTLKPTHGIEFPQMDEWPISSELEASKGGWFVLAGGFNYLTWLQMSPVACNLSREFDAEVWHVCRDETGMARVDLWIGGRLRTTMPYELYGEDWNCSCPAEDASADTLWTNERETRSNYIPRTSKKSCSIHNTSWRVVESDTERRARRRQAARLAVEARRVEREKEPEKERVARRVAEAEGCKIKYPKIPPDELEPGSWKVVLIHPVLGKFGGWTLAEAVEKMMIAKHQPQHAASTAALVKRRHGDIEPMAGFDEAWEEAMRASVRISRAVASRRRAPRRRAGRGRR